MSDIPVIRRQNSRAQVEQARQQWGAGRRRIGKGLPITSFVLGAAVAALLFIATPVVPLAMDWFDAETTEQVDDASMQVLKHRLSLVGKMDPVQAKVLTKELSRVHRYEQQLRKRAAALDAILKDALELDYNQIDQVAPLQESKLANPTEEVGIGGGKEPLAPIVRMPSKYSKAKKKIGKARLLNLVDVMEYQMEQLSHVPLGAPVQGRISSRYGVRRSPFSRRRRMHHGMDFSIDRRTEVQATADGVVKEAGYIGAYGRTVVIDHGNGYETLYGHLSKVSVKPGTPICRGERLGLAGSTGRSTGPHVHYEVRLDGKPTNPKALVELASFLRLI